LHISVGVVLTHELHGLLPGQFDVALQTPFGSIFRPVQFGNGGGFCAATLSTTYVAANVAISTNVALMNREYLTFRFVNFTHISLDSSQS
jgi:hypothetical protein